MAPSRRDFIKLCTATVMGFGIARMYHPLVQAAFAKAATAANPPLFWLQGQSCSGCTLSLLNDVHPGIGELLTSVMNLEYHPMLMTGEGEKAFDSLLEGSAATKGKSILVVEGSIPLGGEGLYCLMGKQRNHRFTMEETLRILAPDAAVIVAVGTCAAYGGVVAAAGQHTGAVSVSAFLHEKGIATPVVNVPGCPPHPDWIVGTLMMLFEALAKPEDTASFNGRAHSAPGEVLNSLADFLNTLDEAGRPGAFFGRRVHAHCPLLAAYESQKMAALISDHEGCRFKTGCKGPQSACDVFERKWNGRVNWCVKNAVCIGCTEPDFPDGKTPFYKNQA